MSIKSFVFDQYGYYPEEIIDNTFIIDNWLFKLETTLDKTEDEISELAQFSLQVSKSFQGRGAQIIKNRVNKYISFGQGEPYALIAVPISKVGYHEVLHLNKTFNKKQTNNEFKISTLITIWSERYDNIEKQCFSSLKMDDIHYNDVYTAVSCAFGLAENAIQYLADAKLDYDDNIENLSVVHRRLNSLDSWTFFNPFNLIYDNSLRDIAELYKFELISIEEFINILDEMNYNKKEASILMGRLMYPTRIFDLLEDNYLNIQSIHKKAVEYCAYIDKEITRLKNAHRILVRKYQIRPIAWLHE